MIVKKAYGKPKISNVLQSFLFLFSRVIDDKKYQRNQLMFNVCFVCYPWSRTVQFEAPLKKLSEFLLNLELQLEFLSNEENTPRLVSLLDNVFNQVWPPKLFPLDFLVKENCLPCGQSIDLLSRKTPFNDFASCETAAGNFFYFVV